MLALDLAVNRMNFLKAGEKRCVRAHLRDMQDLLHLTAHSLQELCGCSLRSEILPARWIKEAEQDMRWMNATGVTVCKEDSLPDLLQEIYDPPFLLMVRGLLLPKRSVAIVGTRKATKRGKAAAYLLAAQAAAAGYTVISGLAHGIDATAHLAAVDAERSTIAVLASGIDRIYPAVHKKLAARILDTGGCLVSENAPGTPPLKYLFPIRNRIVSGLTTSVIVVEAPLRSGAMITARLALDQGREVYVHQSGLQKGMDGTKKLVEDGAAIIHHFEEVIEPDNGGAAMVKEQEVEYDRYRCR